MDRFCKTLLADDFAKVAQVLWTIKEKNEQLQGMEKLLEKIPEKGDYYKYELDEG